MANWFSRIVDHLTGRGAGESSPVPPAPPTERQPAKERGFFGRAIDRLTGAERRREREELEAQRREIQARESALRVREQQLARQQTVRQQVEEAQAKDQQRREQERQQREQTRQRSMTKAERRADELRQQRPVMPEKIMGLGEKGRLGNLYQSSNEADIMRRLGDAAQIDGRRVSLTITYNDGTSRDLFVEQGKKGGRGVSASFLKGLVDKHANGNLGAWLAGGCTGMPGKYQDEDFYGERALYLNLYEYHMTRNW